MTAIKINAAMPLPPPFSNDQNTFVSSDSISSVNETQQFICQIPKTGTITGFGFINGAGSPSIGYRIDTVNTSGYGSGTLYHANASITGVSISANTSNDCTFASSFTGTKGDIVSCILEDEGGATFNPQFIDLMPNQVFPYVINQTGATTWNFDLDAAPSVYFKYDDGSYVAPFGAYPIEAITTRTLSVSLRYVGNVFVPDVDMTVSGAWMYADIDGDCTIYLLEDDHNGTTGVLAQVEYDANYRDNLEIGIVNFTFEDVDLTAGSKYRIAAAYSTSSTAKFTRFDFHNADMLDACYLSNSASYYATESTGVPTGDSDWSDMNGTDVADCAVYMMGLMISEIEVTGGGGGDSFQVSGAHGAG